MKTIFLSGYAKVPKGTNLSNSETFGVMLEIDISTNEIIDADSTFVTELAKDYFKRLLVGRDFITDIDSIIEDIDKHMLIPSALSVEMALKIAHQRYEDKFINKNI